MREGVVNESPGLFFNRLRFPAGAVSKLSPSQGNYFSSLCLSLSSVFHNAGGTYLTSVRFLSLRKSGVRALVAGGSWGYTNILVTLAIRK